jgi:uncharacterized cofD-like protein
LTTPLRIVCLGGGTGLPQLLTGLKLLARDARYADRIQLDHLTVIVTAFDDGGSSGRIVEAYHTLPPGDLRNCLLALADERSEPLLTRFFNHRFREDEHEALAGHSVGNLLLLTLSQIYGGDIRKALVAIKQILPIQSTLLFPTLSPAVLCARLVTGTEVRGESRIAMRADRAPIDQLFLEHRESGARSSFPPMEGVIDAIRQADILTFGPGSLYTSILPHFLVDGIADAVRTSKALKLYLCNLMAEGGETDGYQLADHVSRLEASAGIEVDVVLANDSPVPEELRRAYERARADQVLRSALARLDQAFSSTLEGNEPAERLPESVRQVTASLERLAERLSHHEREFVQILPGSSEALPFRIRLLTTDLLADVEVTEKGGGTKRVIRHDPLKLARAILRAWDMFSDMRLK